MEDTRDNFNCLPAGHYRECGNRGRKISGGLLWPDSHIPRRIKYSPLESLGTETSPNKETYDPERIFMDNVLEVKSINKSFGALTPLPRLTLTSNAARYIVLWRERCRKINLGKIIAGIHTPDNGEIIFQDVSYKELTPAKAKELRIAMVTQELNLMPHLTISENIFMFEKDSYKNGILDRKSINQKSEKLFEQFNLSNLPPVTTKVANLTLAQQQIVEIIKAISKRTTC